jgi:hypothetical protein
VPRKKTPADIAAGKLVLAIQNVWGYRLGTDQAADAEAAMNKAHELHQAAVAGKLHQILGNDSVVDYIGRAWVECHPSVKESVETLEATVTIVDPVEVPYRAKLPP